MNFKNFSRAQFSKLRNGINGVGEFRYDTKPTFRVTRVIGNCLGVPTFYRHRHTHTHTHISAHAISLVFLRKSKNKIKIQKSVIKENKNKITERGGSVVTHETRIREVPGSNPGADQPDWGFFVVFLSPQGKCWVGFSLPRSI